MLDKRKAQLLPEVVCVPPTPHQQLVHLERPMAHPVLVLSSRERRMRPSGIIPRRTAKFSAACGPCSDATPVDDAFESNRSSRHRSAVEVTPNDKRSVGTAGP